jgi:hypothetical protein
MHVGGNGVLFFATEKKIKKFIKGFQSCLPTLPAYFPFETSFRTISPEIPGPVSQTKLKNIMAEMRF